jgi:hypothetical protein
MIVAFVGTIYEDSHAPISGNGKTGSMTSFAFLDHENKGKTIWSNYQTDFSEKICGLQEMIDEIGNEQHDDLILCVSEMGRILNSIGSKQDIVLFIEEFTSQMRKLRVELYWDTQRYRSIHVRLRTITDYIFIPRKYHFDGIECNYNLCKKPHMVSVYSYKPPQDNPDKPLITFDMTKIGKHYDHEQVIYDKIILKGKSKNKRDDN